MQHPDELEARELAYGRQRRLQQRAALEKGRRKRDLNAAVRKAVREGHLDGVRLIEGGLREDVEAEKIAMEAVRDWAILDALKIIRGMGPARCYEVIVTLHATPTTKLGDLSWSRRQELGRLVRAVAGRALDRPAKKTTKEVQDG